LVYQYICRNHAKAQHDLANRHIGAKKQVRRACLPGSPKV
jgi:hypothetical protein